MSPLTSNALFILQEMIICALFKNSYPFFQAKVPLWWCVCMSLIHISWIQYKYVIQRWDPYTETITDNYHYAYQNAMKY